MFESVLLFFKFWYILLLLSLIDQQGCISVERERERVGSEKRRRGDKVAEGRTREKKGEEAMKMNHGRGRTRRKKKKEQ